MIKSEEEWKKILEADRFRILRQKGTEYPHTGIYNLHFKKGIYCCGGCGSPLFDSDSKFESHCGWPSFDNAIKGRVTFVLDKSHGMIRTEVVCSNCEGHLGHVFNEDSSPTGQRFCINSLSIDFNE